ncbi:Uncharacterised protein [Bordetella pertussis]|nr:Uncharacterised protein [Bordetella pertussis]
MSTSGSTRGSSATAAGELCRVSGMGTKCTGASSTWWAPVTRAGRTCQTRITAQAEMNT